MSGLKNWGNNCFVNVIIQSLRYSKPLLHHLIDVNPVDPFANALCHLLFQGNEHMLSVLMKHMPSIKMDPAIQNDAHEFYLSLMDRLQAEADIPLGSTVSTLTCQCGYRTTNSEHFFSISINGDVESGIVEYQKCENVNATCEECGHVGLVKSLTINPSKVWVLHLKRFTPTRKLHYDVNLPKTLTLGNRSWRLVAVCNHYGNMNGGHYTACALTDDGWQVFNDDSVTQVDGLPVESTLPYILFYVEIIKTI